MTTDPSAAATRERYFAGMAKTDPGALLRHRTRVWTVTHRRMLDGSVRLTLRHGRRTHVVFVPVSITGPDLWDCDLVPVSSAPTQQSLPGMSTN